MGAQQNATPESEPLYRFTILRTKKDWTIPVCFCTAMDNFFHFEFATSLSNFTNITSCKFNFTSQEAIMRPDKNSKCSVDTFPSAIFRIIWMERKGKTKVMDKLTVMPVNHLWQTAACAGILITRMYSSRMRTVRCSGHLLGGVLPRGCLPRGVCLGGFLPGVSTQEGCLPRGCLPRGVSAQGVVSA